MEIKFYKTRLELFVELLLLSLKFEPEPLITLGPDTEFVSTIVNLRVSVVEETQLANVADSLHHLMLVAHRLLNNEVLFGGDEASRVKQGFGNSVDKCH